MAAVSVLTTATLIYTAIGSATVPSQVFITNNSAGTIYLGSTAAVTTSTGIAALAASSVGLSLVAGQKVYGIAGSTLEVRVESW